MALALLALLNSLTVQQWQWIILAMVIALFISHFTFTFSFHGNNGEPPGSRGCPFFGETFAFIAANKSSKGVYEFVHQRHLRFGREFKTMIFGKTHVFVPGPEVAKLVFSGEFSEFTKSYIRSMHDAVGDHSLLCVKQQTHIKLRRLLGELFTVEALAKSLPRIDNLITHSLTHWKDFNSVRVIDHTLDITFKIMCGMLLSVEGNEEINTIRKDVDLVSDAMLSLPIKLPGTRYYSGIKARRRFMKFLDVLIERRRSRKENHDDFLQSMLSRDEMLTDVELKDNILTLILAGQTTTAAAMMWAVKYIDQNQHVQHKLRTEQNMVRQRCKDHLKWEDINGMIYTSKVVKEVLRMASIVSWMPRVALNDCNVQGFQMKKGWVLNIDARYTHFDPSIFKDPFEFNPSRFDETLKPYTFLAFGGGVRRCVGINLAKLIITIFLHRLVTTYRWKVEDGDMSLEPWAHFPRLRNGCPITVEPIQ